MALRGGQDEGRHAADACVRACQAIERVLSKEPVDREVYREGATLLQTALLALDAANHAIMGSASETKRRVSPSGRPFDVPRERFLGAADLGRAVPGDKVVEG